MRRKAGREPTTIPDGLGPNIGSAVRAVVRDLPVPAAVLDLDGHAWTWNEAAEMLFPPPPQTPAATYPLFSLGSQPWFDQVRAAALRGRGSRDLQWRLRGVGGTRYRLGMDITPLRDEYGAIVAMLALLQDTTARDRRSDVARSFRADAKLHDWRIESVRLGVPRPDRRDDRAQRNTSVHSGVSC